jgi:hypothetical protein
MVMDGYPTGRFSLNGSYRFNRDEREGPSTVPFITGGYSRVSDFNGINLGTGIDYWFRERTGLRFEIRGTRVEKPAQYNFVPHPVVLEFRVGLNFHRPRSN